MERVRGGKIEYSIGRQAFPARIPSDAFDKFHLLCMVPFFGNAFVPYSSRLEYSIYFPGASIVREPQAITHAALTEPYLHLMKSISKRF